MTKQANEPVPGRLRSVLAHPQYAVYSVINKGPKLFQAGISSYGQNPLVAHNHIFGCQGSFTPIIYEESRFIQEDN